MAKYKFTKTIRPTEGICIDADGTVTKLSVPSVPLARSAVVTTASMMPHATTTASPTVRGRTRKHDKWARLKGFVPPAFGPAAPAPRPHRKPKITVPLSSAANPYYGERAMHDVPPARPCGMFGLSRPKPITRTAAMSFQNRGT